MPDATTQRAAPVVSQRPRAGIRIVDRWREREINPVLLKELRQAVRSRTVLSALWAFLGALSITSLVFLVRNGFVAEMEPRLGLPVFRAFVIILCIACVFFLPLYVGLRLALERRESSLDLMFVTTLKPEQIVMGKLLSGACIAGMFVSVCAPFTAFTNLLRGIDHLTALFIIVCLYAVVWLVLQLAILLACVPALLPVKLLAGALFVAGLGGACWGLTRFFVGLITTGVGSQMGTATFWIGLAGLGTILAVLIRIFYRMSVVLIVNDNRPRGYYDEVIPVELRGRTV